jgi:hypothetical protein
MIGTLYAVEQHIREARLVGEARRAYRLAHAKPVLGQFFAWIDAQFDTQGLLPSSPLTTAMAYVRERRAALEVYLTDPDVPIDTNHLERALRVVPMGRRNWLFCWTEVGAKYVGIAQSLIATCRLHDIDPYTYLVDVLQRVGQHPAADVAQLTPRLWKQHFADNPLRSDLFEVSGRQERWGVTAYDIGAGVSMLIVQKTRRLWKEVHKMLAQAVECERVLVSWNVV